MKFGFCDFSWGHYRNIVAYLKDTRQVVLYREPLELPSQNYAVLRHDIDMSIDNAVDIAQIEYEVGVRATYFIRLDAIYYNPMTLPNYRSLRQILEWGHDIGLHYSASWSLVSSDSPYTVIDRQLYILQEFLQHEIKVGAAHEPTRLNIDVAAVSQNTNLKVEAYDPKFFQQMKYLSDSAGRWREGCACGWLDHKTSLCILTHPFWWYKEVPMERY